jgi:hypothetical protein
MGKANLQPADRTQSVRRLVRLPRAMLCCNLIPLSLPYYPFIATIYAACSKQFLQHDLCCKKNQQHGLCCKKSRKHFRNMIFVAKTSHNMTFVAKTSRNVTFVANVSATRLLLKKFLQQYLYCNDEDCPSAA